MLHLTNGGSSAQTIAATGIGGDVVAWNDVLHEGPVPAALPLTALSAVRARFIADMGWAPHDEVAADFARRDAALLNFRAHDEVVLWFEHDLYDQLQLLQILDQLVQQERGETRLNLIAIDHFPGVERFTGLGELSAEQLATLWPGRQPVSDAALQLARRAWAAFRAPDPRALAALLADDTRALPLLAPALRRHLLQYPAVGSGLSQSERMILELIDSGVSQQVELFLGQAAREPAPFLGDTTFWSYLARLTQKPAPLVERTDGGRFEPPGDAPDARFRAQQLRLTEHGRAVLEGRADYVRLAGIDRWLGGVHLEDVDTVWRWDPHQDTVVPQP